MAAWILSWIFLAGIGPATHLSIRHDPSDRALDCALGAPECSALEPLAENPFPLSLVLEQERGDRLLGTCIGETAFTDPLCPQNLQLGAEDPARGLR